MGVVIHGEDDGQGGGTPPVSFPYSINNSLMSTSGNVEVLHNNLVVTGLDDSKQYTVHGFVLFGNTNTIRRTNVLFRVNGVQTYPVLISCESQDINDRHPCEYSSTHTPVNGELDCRVLFYRSIGTGTTLAQVFYSSIYLREQ